MLFSCDEIQSIDSKMVEVFVGIFLYDSFSSSSVHEFGQYCFTKCNRMIDNGPPTQDVLPQHIKKVILRS